MMSTSSIFTNSSILITGGSGSWGNELTSQLLHFSPKKIVIFSRGEIAQVAMERKFNNPLIEFVIGDVRDNGSLYRAFLGGIDYVFHLAALKHVPICENHPQEAIKTNINGTINVINASIKNKVKKFIFVSTDKAVDPINLYGMTKGACERLVIQANCLTNSTDFICIRGGNALGSNGSVIPYVIDQIKTKNEVTITDEGMTRFFLTLQDAVKLLLFATEEGVGGETYVMNMPSFYIKDLIEILVEYYGNKDTKIKTIGMREGEKRHETLIAKNEVHRTEKVNDNYYMIKPELKINRKLGYHTWEQEEFKIYHSLQCLSSEQNLKLKSILKEMMQKGGFLK